MYFWDGRPTKPQKNKINHSLCHADGHCLLDIGKESYKNSHKMQFKIWLPYNFGFSWVHLLINLEVYFDFGVKEVLTVELSQKVKFLLSIIVKCQKHNDILSFFPTFEYHKIQINQTVLGKYNLYK